MEIGGRHTPDIPPRSRLYHLEPVGVGTPHVESLSGYASRLAGEHSTTLYYLFSEEVAPLIGKPGTISGRVSFASFSKAANGLGVTATDLVEVFERLTLRRDLRFTTLLPWAGLISSKNLTRELRAWCPACYEEDAACSGKVYDQLLWQIQCVTACARHECRLEHECPHCGRRQVSLSHRICPGFCGRCLGRLGRRPGSYLQNHSSESSQIMEEELVVAEEVGKLLAAAPDLLPRVLLTCFSANLRRHTGSMFQGRGVTSPIRLPADKQTVRCWLRGTQSPSLPLLLETCLALKVSPLDLLRNDNYEGLSCDEVVWAHGEAPASFRGEADEGRAGSHYVDWTNQESLAYVESRLRAALEEYPPSSLTKIARGLRCAKGMLRKKFPLLAAQVAARAEDYFRPRVGDETMLEVLREALGEEPPPSLNDVSHRIGRGASTTTLHKKFPKESREIVERYGAVRKRRLDDEAIEKILRAALETHPPPSTPEVSRAIGVSRATLYSKFPDLFRAISSRSALFRRERDARNREAARAEIRTICESLLREGQYPSDALVRSMMTTPCQSQIFSEARREALAGFTLP